MVHLHGWMLGRWWDVVPGCSQSGQGVSGLEKPGLSRVAPRQLPAPGRRQWRASGTCWEGEWWTLWGGRGRREGREREVHQEMQKASTGQWGEDLGRALLVTRRRWEEHGCRQWTLEERKVG